MEKLFMARIAISVLFAPKGWIWLGDLGLSDGFTASSFYPIDTRG